VTPRGILIGVSREAEKRGVRVGMTVAQAVVRYADLVVRPLDRTALSAARAALRDAALSLSPRVEPLGEEILLDVAGLVGRERLIGSFEGLGAALARRAERVGLGVGVGIADRRATARIAALAASNGSVIVVPAGEDAAWLAPQPLTTLVALSDPSTCAEVIETWKVLGIESLGQLARIPVTEIGTRFGALGVHLWRMAAGCDATPITPFPPALDLTEGSDLEHGVDSFEGLVFVVRGLLDRLMGRLEMHGLACRGLTLDLSLEDGNRHSFPVEVLSPTRDVKALASLTRYALSNAPPRAAVMGVVIVAHPDSARPAQLDLFRPPGPPPAQLATALARLAALCGADRVGYPLPPAGHRPEAWSLRPFAAEKANQNSKRGVLSSPPVDSPALRALRPPRPVQVFQERGSIVFVRAAGFGGRAVVTSGPWRIETEWWSPSPCRRDYYDVQLSDGGVYRLYCEHGNASQDTRGERREGWYIDGYYD
jgi:protein ImuB